MHSDRTRALSAFALLVLLAPATAAARPSVCVLPFDNHTGDATWDPLRRGLADMVATDLAATPGLQVVERARLAEVLAEQDMQASDRVDPATAGRIGKLVGAAYAVTGTITAVEPRIRIDIRLVRVESGEVLVAEQVVGDRAKFFELEQALVAKFVAGLGARLADPAAGRVDDVQTVVAYGQAVELAEKGDLEAASKQLRTVVTAAPAFKLAQTEYEQVLRRLMEAKKARGAGLLSADQALMEKADRELSKVQPKKASKKTLQRFFGYRFLRGNLFLGRIAALVGAKASPLGHGTVPDGARADVLGLVQRYVENQQALMGELATARGRRLEWSFLFPQIDDDDTRAARELGLGGQSHAIAFASPQFVARMLAQFLCLGSPGMHNSVLLTLTPTPAALDPRWEKEATALLDGALADLAQHETRHKDREIVRTLTLYGDCLLARGRKMEAIARWQEILDTYPTTPQFGDIERKITKAMSAP
jgi:TolB-like protein